MKIYCENGSIYENYSNFIRSNAWRSKRKKFLASKLFTGCCWICGSKNRIQVHHKTYVRIGKEKLNDLVALCENCHNELHDKLSEKINSRANWNEVRRMRKKFIKQKKFLNKDKIKENKINKENKENKITNYKIRKKVYNKDEIKVRNLLKKIHYESEIPLFLKA